MGPIDWRDFVIFWRTKHLADRLRARDLSASEEFKYLAAWCMAVSFATTLPDGEAVDATKWLTAAIDASISIVAITILFLVNRRGDNELFICRVVCISWPIAFKCGILWAVGGEILGTCHPYLNGFIAEIVRWLIDMLSFMLFFWRVYVHLEYVSRTSLPSQLRS